MEQTKKQTINFNLTEKSIDLISLRTGEALSKAKLDSSYMLRIRLSVEEALLCWRERLGENTDCVFESGTRLGRQYLRISAKGIKVDPYRETDDILADSVGAQNLLLRLGIKAAFEYRNGVNEITVTPPKKERNKLLLIAVMAIVAAAAGLLIRSLLPELRAVISNDIVAPVFKTLLSLFTTISYPLIFLALCTGIYGIGDIALLGQMSKKTIVKLISNVFFFLIVYLFCVIWFFPVSFTQSFTGQSDSWNKILEIILNVIPKNIFSPFIDGNALQIIFLAVVFGIALLVLGRKVTGLANGIDQLYSAFQTVMGYLGKLIPAFIFLCVFNLVISDMEFDTSCIGKLVILSLSCSVVFAVGHVILLSVRFKISLKSSLKKLLPILLTGISTGSSSASFAVNCETCRKNLGINKKLVDFGVPIGQVIFKPAIACAFLVNSLCIAELYSVAITPFWLVVCIIMAGLLSIATPPATGGSLSCYALLFSQLGIPPEGVAIAISFDALFDYLNTGSNLLSLQSELASCADKLSMIDHEVIES